MTVSTTAEPESTGDTSGAGPTDATTGAPTTGDTAATSTTEAGTDGTSTDTSTGVDVTATGASTGDATGASTGDATGASAGETSETSAGDTTDASSSSGDVDPCGPDGEGPLLDCFVGCPDALFAVAPYVEEFDDPAQYAAHWTGTWAAPTLAGGALNFGPHPMTIDWWDNYSPTWSKEQYGDALVCARLRLTPPPVAVPDEDMFEITVRLPEDAAYETGAMSLALLTAEAKLLFRTRIAQAQWQLHAEAPLPIDRGVENTIDVLIYAQGDEYVAELRNAAHPDAITVLPAAAQFSPTGLMTLLGWRDSEAVHLDRLVIGAPSAAAHARLAAELP